MPAHPTAELHIPSAQTLRRQRAKLAPASNVETVKSASAGAAEAVCVDVVNAEFLESLLGYNARRASLALVDVFMQSMARFDLKIVEFSVLSLVGGNPGITSRQLCKQLDMLPPNMVGMIDVLGQRGLLEKRPHPRDGRATGLYLSMTGQALIDMAEPEIKARENAALGRLTSEEQALLITLLQKLYR